jgi:hypothetical protein
VTCVFQLFSVVEHDAFGREAEQRDWPSASDGACALHATVDLDVECLRRSLKLDTVTVSQRFKSDDLDDAATNVEALS